MGAAMNSTPVAALTDAHGRKMRKLRISLLDACNFRCVYCLPEKPKFMSAAKWLSPRKITDIVKVLMSQGIEELRITGGEPTLRRELLEIVAQLSSLNPKKLGLTTNGLLLGKLLEPLAETGCRHINISLDSLRPEKFKTIARFDGFDATMGAILRAQELGFSVRLNTVLMAGFNDDELFEFVEFSAATGVAVRFLEMMPIGQASKLPPGTFYSAGAAEARLRERYNLTPVVSPNDSTSYVFATDSGAQIGFIAPVTRPFCGHCSRWRLAADGFLRTCLMSDAGVALRGKTDDEIIAACRAALPLKPKVGMTPITENMNTIGG
jgi:GTP 3',8-cyclase